MVEKSQKYCRYCNEPIKGRADKQFCNSFCKSAYHNQKPNTEEAYIRNINSLLRKNRAALKKACPMGKATVRKSFLIKLGMDFKFFTHGWKSANGNYYYFCYDYGYMHVNDPEKVLIIQKQSYMK